MVTAVAPIESAGCIVTVGMATGAVEYSVVVGTAIEAVGIPIGTRGHSVAVVTPIGIARYTVAADSYFYPHIRCSVFTSYM